ncbi:MAG: serine/threonine protein kinase [Planctomyces sp.]|nr:serine/threonine protein kinase [Planctomyces sp.]
MDVAERYELLETIGAGSFATVYRAQDRELGREVAVKQIQAQFLAGSVQTERYWREATLLASFQHPHIVTIFDVVRERGWLILELMQANLRDRLQGRAMEARAVQTTVIQALRALSALHGRGVVHGDIKPSNLMIDHRKRIKVGDFGLAWRVSHDEGSVIRGTAKYMAPETLSQEFGDVGPESDLYSLGFTAYELLCGSKFEGLFPGLDAFGRDRQAAWMMWHAAADRKLPDIGRVLEATPPGLARAINRLIEKDPRRRYATADEALQDLGSNADETQASVAQPVAPAAAGSGFSTQRLIAIGAFAASMIASAAMLLWNPSKPPEPTSAAPTIQGVIRTVDAEAGVIEYQDPTTGQPDEFRLPDKPRIRLRGDGLQDEFVLARRLQPGDWIRTTNVDGRFQLDVSRPVSSTGRLTSVDVDQRRITALIENQRLRDSLTLHVPHSARIKLNDSPSQLKELAADDAVSIVHLLDPAGEQGRVVSELSATRRIEFEATLIDVDPVTRRISLLPAGDDPQTRRFTVTDDVSIVFDDGSPASDSDIAPGQRVRVTADVLLRQLVLPR